jgi:hypothetical protein
MEALLYREENPTLSQDYLSLGLPSQFSRFS